MSERFPWREVRSELARMRRPGVLVGWLGLTAVLAALVNAVMFSVTTKGGGAPTAGPGVDFPSLAVLESAKGLTAGLSAASSLLGVVTLAFWAILTAADYSSGLVRLLTAAQPRRWRLLVGKLLALSLSTAGVALLAVVVDLAAAPVGARAAGVSTAAWRSVGAGDLVSAATGLFAALLGWGIFGLALATLTRSAAIAVSTGIGYVLLLEGVLASLLGAAADVLPGSVLTALAHGGTTELSGRGALSLGLLYAALALTASLVVFQQRDVTD